MRETENKNIAVGEQALDVAARLNFTVSAISAARNVRRLEEQARRFHVRCAAMADESAAKELKLRLADTDTEIFAGADGICEMIARALVGFALVPIFGYIIICFASPLAWLMADAFLIPAFYYCLRNLLKAQEMLE